MSEKRIIATIAITGEGSERAFNRVNSDPAHFVFPVHEGENIIATPFGKVGVGHYEQIRNGSTVRAVQLDCTDASTLLWRPKENSIHTIEINREGTGVQQAKKGIEIYVATNHFNS